MARMLPREAENIGVGMNRSARGGQVYTALYKNIPILYDNAISYKDPFNRIPGAGHYVLKIRTHLLCHKR